MPFHPGLRTLCGLGVLLFLIKLAPAAAPFLPETVGTTWEYARSGAEPNRVVVRIAGRELIQGDQILTLETLAGDDLLKTEQVSATENGLAIQARATGPGGAVPLDPPVVLVPAPLRVGAAWEVEDDLAGSTAHLKFKVAAQEKVTVPAGDFTAYHLQAAQPWPISVTVDRWFVPGTGFVKEVTTTRGPGGRLLSRVALALTKFSLAPPAPELSPSATISSGPTPPPPPPVFLVEVTRERDGEPTRIFQADAPQIYVCWQGENLPLKATVRIAWIAEDVGDLVEPNFVVDETETDITAPDSSARFTLSRPSDGWAAGQYRLELFLDEVLMEKIPVSITD